MTEDNEDVDYDKHLPDAPGVENSSISIQETLFLTSTSGFVAEIVTYPLDLLKTRQQAFKSLNTPQNVKGLFPLPSVWNNLIRLAKNIIRKEGPLKLWDGLGPALVRQIAATGLRTTMYEKLRDDIFGRDQNKKFRLREAVFAGWCAGSISQVVVSPTDLIKVLLQTEGHRKTLGQKPRVSGSWQAIRLIVNKGGISGLWRGWVVNMHVAALTSVAGLTTYDKCKQICRLRFNLADNYKTHVISSVVTSYITTLVITPADVIKTRIMNQNPIQFGSPKYTSSFDCFVQIFKSEGLWAFYAGFWPSFMRLMPWYLVFWVSYENGRLFFGKDTF